MLSSLLPQWAQLGTSALVDEFEAQWALMRDSYTHTKLSGAPGAWADSTAKNIDYPEICVWENIRHHLLWLF